MAIKRIYLKYMKYLIILFISLTLLGFGCVNQNIKQDMAEDNLLSVKLYYNNSTGELYPLLPKDNSIHTCVWTISGDHGSDVKLTTDTPLLTNESDPSVQANNFLPPRMPIYMSCVDWQNKVYQGQIGEY